MITYKTPEEIQILREGGKILAQILQSVGAQVAPGVSAQELEDTAAALMQQYKVESLFKGFEGFPAVSCISVNEGLVHGIPKADMILVEGDIVSIDAGIRYKKLCVDSAITVPVGKIKPEVQKLLDVTRESLKYGIAAAKLGNTIGDIGHAVQSYVESQGKYGVIRGLVGHGVGHDLHEEPKVPNFGKAGTGMELQPGLVIAIEPMVSLGGYEITTADDGWTIKTADDSLSAHFEHSVAITTDGPVILTTL